MEASKEDFYETCLGLFGRKVSAVSLFLSKLKISDNKVLP